MQKSNKALLVTGILVAFIVLGITIIPELLKKNPATLDSSKLSIGDSPIIGDKNAPVTIYEFTDFSCQFCDRFATETLPQIEKNYVDTGKVKIVFKYYPGHGQAQAAHIVALALYEQDVELFKKFHDYVFSNPSNADSLTKMEDLAISVGADKQELLDAITTSNYLQRLQADTAMAREIGISGTPSFVISNQLIVGAESYSVFDKAIKSALG
jgi:protein-disulfide isomerase